MSDKKYKDAWQENMSNLDMLTKQTLWKDHNDYIQCSIACKHLAKFLLKLAMAIVLVFGWITLFGNVGTPNPIWVDIVAVLACASAWFFFMKLLFSNAAGKTLEKLYCTPYMGGIYYNGNWNI